MRLGESKSNYETKSVLSRKRVSKKSSKIFLFRAIKIGFNIF